MLYQKNTCFLLLILFIVSACSSSTNPDETANFDRAAMLENYGNNIIVPAFETATNLCG
ncbi:hypothetical protein [Fodinibius sp.]|uniref:hypothetical protein n=1 Tax=Fodinibius sp. TaxID=1872440 RepID=UPI002ACE03A4|nr:hypothetical protein [Fodinibius sp.]MDZ7658217.1 hypothetical protein [Fodinibius sp.]